MDVHCPIDGFRRYRSIARFHLQISIARHADFNVKLPRIMPEREAPVAGDASRQLDLVAVLMSVDAQVLSQFVALVFDAKFDLFRVTGGNPQAAKRATLAIPSRMPAEPWESGFMSNTLRKMAF